MNKKKENLLKEIKLFRICLKDTMNSNYGIEYQQKDTTKLYTAWMALNRLLRRAHYLPAWYIEMRYLYIIKQARLI